MKRSFRNALMIFALAQASAVAAAPAPDGVRPGQWQIVHRVLAASSPTMPRHYLDRLRRKADGHVVSRCINSFDAERISAFGPIPGRCTVDQPLLRGGKVAARLACPDRLVRDDALITGTYSRDRFDVTSTMVSSGSPHPLGNASFTTRATGRRIGDCATKTR